MDSYNVTTGNSKAIAQRSHCVHVHVPVSVSLCSFTFRKYWLIQQMYNVHVHAAESQQKQNGLNVTEKCTSKKSK